MCAAGSGPKKWMEESMGLNGDSLDISWYCDGPDKGYFGLLDAYLASLTGPSQAASADPAVIIFDRHRHLLK